MPRTESGPPVKPVRAGRRGGPADRDRLEKPRSVTTVNTVSPLSKAFPVTVDSTSPRRVREGAAPRGVASDRRSAIGAATHVSPYTEVLLRATTSHPAVDRHRAPAGPNGHALRHCLTTPAGRVVTSPARTV